MKLTIDNFDGRGPCEYTAAIERDGQFHIHRVLNGGASLKFSLHLCDPALLVPSSGSEVRVVRDDGVPLFGGAVDEEPEYEFLGWGDRGPMYRLSVSARSDAAFEWKGVGESRELSGTTAGAALKQITHDAAGVEIDCSEVADLDPVYRLEEERRKTWSAHAAEIANSARAAYRVENGKVVLEAIGDRRHEIREDDERFSPEGLTVRRGRAEANDVTVVGGDEAGAFVKEHRIGDGVTNAFSLWQPPMIRPARIIAAETFDGTALAESKWAVRDPASALSCDNDALKITGGTGNDGETTARLIGRIELGGALVMDHATVKFTGASEGILGGLYANEIAREQCIAGFEVAMSADELQVNAVIGAIATGPAFVAEPGKTYRLRTRTYCMEQSRAEQGFHSSEHAAGAPIGGSEIAANVRFVLDIGTVNESNTGCEWTVLYDGVMNSAPAFVTYGLVDAKTMRAELSLTRIARAAEIEIQRAVGGEGPRTVAVGHIRDGFEADLKSGATVQFAAGMEPHLQESLVFRYRLPQTAAARVTDADAGCGGGMVCRVTAPSVVTSLDCENAAKALLDDATKARWSGEYRTWSDALDGDIVPGDEVTVQAPSRGAEFEATVREVWIDARDFEGDRYGYRVKFANDAAERIAMKTSSALREPGELAVTEKDCEQKAIDPIPLLEIYSIGPTQLGFDAGCDPIDGGGFEVRSHDEGWGSESGRIGQYMERQFIVPRVSLVQDFYVRAYDASGRYSRTSTILHLDYPA